MLTAKEQYELIETILHVIDGSIDEASFNAFEKQLVENPEVRQLYILVCREHTELHRSGRLAQVNLFEGEEILKPDLWKALADMEQTAPALRIAKKHPPSSELIQKVVYPPHERWKMSKFNVVSLVISAAAVLLLVLFVKYAPKKQYSLEVATLVDQINVQWTHSSTNIETGSRLWTNKAPLQLNKGIVKIQYDNGVDVLIEGPAVFAIERTGLHLEYGRLYNQVSEAGLGFTVTTPTSQFIDMGTEFGVQADVNGSSELHVLKGKVQLFAGSNGKNKAGKMVTENKAARYDVNRNQIKAIPVEKRTFVRNINSDMGTIWRGQIEIDLADIVSGGNGLMTTTRQQFIIPQSGVISHEFGRKDKVSDYAFHPVDNIFIDGVFIPSIDKGFPPVTSARDEFEDCPSTDSTGWGIFNTRYYLEDVALYKECRSPIFHRELEELEQDAIFMHSNGGITFDLNQIRAVHGHGVIKVFRTGLLFNRSEHNRMIDFWVLIDGQVRYQKLDAKGADAVIPIQIPISDQDRFLSLVLTDGSDDDSDRGWGFFVKPVLVLGDR